MSFLDFFKKKADKGSDNKNVPSGKNIPSDSSSGKQNANTSLNPLMQSLYQQAKQRAQAPSSSTGTPKRVSRDVETVSEGIGSIEALFDMEGHRIPDISNNKAYGYEDEDFALSIPRPKPDPKKARKLYEMGTKEFKPWRDVEYEEEESWGQNCHLLYCSYMFGFRPALKEYQKLREQCRNRYRELCGVIDDYSLLAGLRHPARRFALSSASVSDRFTKVWNSLLDSPYGRNLREDWNLLADAMNHYRVSGPKSSFDDYNNYPITLGSDLERMWAGIYNELHEYVDGLCPIDADAIDKVSDDYQRDDFVHTMLGAFVVTLNSLNAMYDKVFEAVWENPLNLYYNFGEL